MKKGSLIGVVAPSGPLNKYSLNDIEKELNKLGYNVKFGTSCYGSYKGYLSSEDKVRAKDIENMFLDKSVDVIMCLRGGYGTLRILDLIDYSIIKNNPKPFIGFSDITALHIAFKQKADLNTYHGLMASSTPEWDGFSYKSLLTTVNIENGVELQNPNGEPLKVLVQGVAEGTLVGGNLAVLVSTLGTEYEIDTKGKILFLEDVGEPIYKIDRMLSQLVLAGKIDDCNGIIFGDFCDCNKSNNGDFSLEELLLDRVGKYNKPTICNVKAGHCMPMVTLPLGTQCVMDAQNKIVKFEK